MCVHLLASIALPTYKESNEMPSNIRRLNTGQWMLYIQCTVQSRPLLVHCCPLKTKSPNGLTLSVTESMHSPSPTRMHSDVRRWQSTTLLLCSPNPNSTAYFRSRHYTLHNPPIPWDLRPRRFPRRFPPEHIKRLLRDSNSVFLVRVPRLPLRCVAAVHIELCGHGAVVLFLLPPGEKGKRC